MINFCFILGKKQDIIRATEQLLAAAAVGDFESYLWVIYSISMMFFSYLYYLFVYTNGYLDLVNKFSIL